jgi:hypothetical protein
VKTSQYRATFDFAVGGFRFGSNPPYDKAGPKTHAVFSPLDADPVVTISVACDLPIVS